MSRGGLLAGSIVLVSVVLVAAGTIWPSTAAIAFAGGEEHSLTHGASTPQGAVEGLGTQIRLRDWGAAYSRLSNKAEFTQAEFVRDLTGSGLSLRTYATLDGLEVQPLHQTATDAEMIMKLRWSSVVGTFADTRTVKVVKNGDQWSVIWPLAKEQHVPPQVIPVNYLRWDVIYRGAEDDWGTQEVEAPHVRIIDMRPVNRADGAVVMGELLNEDVVPSFVSVRATLLGKNGSVLGSGGSFDMITHTLLPKQVTPFIIRFPGVDLAEVGSVRMEPLSVLISASADPVIEVQNQKYNPAPGAAVTGQLSNQSGHTVNIAHVLSTFYDKDGQVIWIGGQYVDRALHPFTPVDFKVTIPEDLSRKVSSQRTVVAAYTEGSM